MSDVTIVPMANKAFGATATGVDLKNLSDDEFSDLHAAFLEHGFLLFPDQHLDEESSIALGNVSGTWSLVGLLWQTRRNMRTAVSARFMTFSLN